MFGIDDAVMYPMLGSIASGIFNQSSANARQDAAQTFNAQQYATRYQTSVKDMEAAGLNPMLAYGNSPGAGASISPAASAGMPDLGSNMIQSKLAFAQVANIAADTKNKDAQAELIKAQVDQTTASAGQARSASVLAGAQADEIKYKLDRNYWEDDQFRIRMAAKELRSQYELNIEKGKSEVEARKIMVETIQKLQKESKILDFDIKAIEDMNNIGRTAGQLKPIFDVLIPLLK